MMSKIKLVMLVLITATIMLLAPITVSAQFVTGLQGGSGSTVGPDGAIYVTENMAGRVSRVDPVSGTVTTFTEGLPLSLIGIGGAVDIAFIDGTAYVLVSVVDQFVGGVHENGLYRIDGPNSFTIVAHLSVWTLANPPITPFDLPTGVQYAMQPYKGKILITDGHHNRVLLAAVKEEANIADEDITEFMPFGNIVPTGLAVHGKTVYMAEGGASPHEPEDGKVVAFDFKSADVTEIAAGARLPVDVERGRGRSLYVLSQGDWDGAFAGAPSLPFSGSFLQVNADGTMTELLGELNLPTSVEIIEDTAYIVGLDGNITTFTIPKNQPWGQTH